MSRRTIEYTLVSADGIFSGDGIFQFHQFRDDAYYRDGLGQLLACEAMLLGRVTYEGFAPLWPGRKHPWADAINAIPKYVFSNTLDSAEWSNSTIVRGDAVEEVRRLKQQDGGDLLVWGHGRLSESLLQAGLIDVIDLSIHPLFLGAGQTFFRARQTAGLQLIAAKTFARGIVKLTYEPQYA
jgi:dihydrofolate reductase